jgi:hypothetical protein
MCVKDKFKCQIRRSPRVGNKNNNLLRLLADGQLRRRPDLIKLIKSMAKIGN